MFASLCVLCELCEIENGMGCTKNFAWRYGVQSSEFRTEAQRGFKDLAASLCVLCELCEIENGMGCTKNFAWRHRVHRGFSRICLLLFVSFVISVRGRVSHGGTEGTEGF